MTRATTLLFLLICTFPQHVFANATSSSKIGISVFIKETQKCDFHIASEGGQPLSLLSSSNCQIKADKIQKQFTQIIYQQQNLSSNGGFSRVVLIVQ